MTADDSFTSGSRSVLGMRVDAIEFDAAARSILGWAAARASESAEALRGCYVCAANVHMTMLAHDDPSFRSVVNAADLVLPDGQPMVWALRLLGLPQKHRVRVAPDLVLQLFAGAEARHVRVGLYGGSAETLTAFVGRLRDQYPRLDLAYAWDPPFRPLTEEEDREQTEQIRASGTQLLLIGLGCPKQERWMAEHCDELQCALVGVGAAFDMLGGKTRNAPVWMQERGLEWVFRLASEPRRLWRRHVLNDPRFLALLARQYLRGASLP